MISCKQASRAFSQMQDGPAPVALYLRLRLHVLLCDGCRRFERQLHFLRRALQRYRE